MILHNLICVVCGTKFLYIQRRKSDPLRKTCSGKCCASIGSSAALLCPKHPCTEDERKKRSDAKIGDKNPNWKPKGNIHMASLHAYVRRHKPQPELCEICQSSPSLDLACIDNRYTRNIDDYQYLCRKCHMLSDGRMNNLNRKGDIPKKIK